MRIIDTHLHLVYPDRFSYPWLEQAPAINRAWHFEDYWTEAERLGIEMALHMEVDVAEQQMEDETRHVLSLDRRICGAIAAARPEQKTFPAELDRLATIKGVKGIRRVLHTQPDELSRSEICAGCRCTISPSICACWRDSCPWAASSRRSVLTSSSY